MSERRTPKKKPTTVERSSAVKPVAAPVEAIEPQNIEPQQLDLPIKSGLKTAIKVVLAAPIPKVVKWLGAGLLMTGLGAYSYYADAAGQVLPVIECIGCALA